MSNHLRRRLHNAVDRLPQDRLVDMLTFVEMVVNEPEADLEDAWMLSSGAFRLRMEDTEEIVVIRQD